MLILHSVNHVIALSASLIFSILLMGFIEHQFHAKFMHRRNFLSKRSAKYKRVFEAHAIFHHGTYSKVFSDEPVPKGEDEEIQLTVRKAPIKAFPFALLMSLVYWPAGLIFIGVVVYHHWVWNKIHLEMHKPEDKFFSKWPLYKFVWRYHWLHHKYPEKNFNVVFPIFDFVLGTLAKPTAKDLIEMEEQMKYRPAKKEKELAGVR